MPISIDYWKDKAHLVVDCAETIIYWRGSVFERVEGVNHFYRTALQTIRETVKWYETESMGEVRPVQANTFDLLPRWLKEPRSRRGMMGLKLESGDRAESSSNMSFSIFCDEEDPQPMGYIRLVTPSGALERDPNAFLHTSLNLAERLTFESGSAGYSINWDRNSDLAPSAEQYVSRIAATYLGVEIEDPNTTLISLQNSERPAFKRVNWITFLGQNLTSVAGFPQFDNGVGIRVHNLPNGSAVVAGAVPHRSGDLVAYHSVGRSLAPFRVREHAALFGSDDDKSEHWLSTFD